MNERGYNIRQKVKVTDDKGMENKSRLATIVGTTFKYVWFVFDGEEQKDPIRKHNKYIVTLG